MVAKAATDEGGVPVRIREIHGALAKQHGLQRLRGMGRLPSKIRTRTAAQHRIASLQRHVSPPHLSLQPLQRGYLSRRDSG